MKERSEIPSDSHMLLSITRMHIGLQNKNENNAKEWKFGWCKISSLIGILAWQQIYMLVWRKYTCISRNQFSSWFSLLLEMGGVKNPGRESRRQKGIFSSLEKVALCLWFLWKQANMFRVFFLCTYIQKLKEKHNSLNIRQKKGHLIIVNSGWDAVKWIQYMANVICVICHSQKCNKKPTHTKI